MTTDSHLTWYRGQNERLQKRNDMLEEALSAAERKLETVHKGISAIVAQRVRALLGAHAAGPALDQQMDDGDESAGAPIHSVQPSQPTERPIHTWFGLSYSNFLVLHRACLQAMPDAWQR